MALPVYTTRFISRAGAGGTTNYVVPAGYRAVVKSIVCWTYQTTAEVWLSIAAKQCWVWAANPATTLGRAELMTAVAYQGETITLLTIGSNCGAHVAGFLLRETSAYAGLLPDLPPEFVEVPEHHDDDQAHDVREAA